MIRPTVTVHTDGACKRNSSGGWAALLQHGHYSDVIYDAASNTTANRMELAAVINALSVLTVSCNVILYSDSKYVVDGIARNLKHWLKNGWRTRQNKPVMNKDLWLQLVDLLNTHNVMVQWVKGHAANEGNLAADFFAQNACII